MISSNNNTAAAFLEEFMKDNSTLLDSLGYPVFIVDSLYNIVASNKAMKMLWGDDLQNRKCYELLHQCDHPIEDCILAKTLKSRNTEEMEIYEPGLKKHLKITSYPVMTAGGNPVGAVHSIMDITRLKEIEENDNELIEIYSSSINEMKAREMKAQRGRDAFLNMLEDISDSYKELEDLFLKLIRVMVNALDAKSPWTRGHSDRVSMYAEQIAEEMLIDREEIRNIRLAGVLHDIGKIGTYDHLLDKPGRLTKDEFDIVKKHPAQGAEILRGIKQLKNIIPLIEYHHEKIDGTGYPYRLKDAEIPLGARILHVADSFDSMTSDRPYRPAPGIEYALSELHKLKGSQFDGQVVEAFLRVLEKENKKAYS